MSSQFLVLEIAEWIQLRCIGGALCIVALGSPVHAQEMPKISQTVAEPTALQSNRHLQLENEVAELKTMYSNTSAMTAVDCLVAEQAATQGEPLAPTSTQPPDLGWQYGGFLDVGYLHDFNYPANHLFRSRGTTFHVNEWHVNMAAIYLKKAASERSRWGTELTLQAGEDSKVFGFSATAPNLPGSKWLRHLGPTNISYLAPVGKGLNLQGGIV